MYILEIFFFTKIKNMKNDKNYKRISRRSKVEKKLISSNFERN